MHYRLICFDAGFTLLEPRRTTAATMATILAAEGVTPTDEALRRAWNTADRWFWEDYQRPDNDTWVSDERIKHTWRQHHGLMLRELGVEDKDFRIADLVIHTYSQAENWKLYDDVLPTLEILRGTDLRLGIVSDWGSLLPEIIEALGLKPYFDFVLASATAGAAKPTARFYRMAAERASVEPGQALMVGDSYYGDVRGARSAGMDAVLLDRTGQATAEDVTRIRSLQELLPLLGLGER